MDVFEGYFFFFSVAVVMVIVTLHLEERASRLLRCIFLLSLLRRCISLSLRVKELDLIILRYDTQIS